MTWLLGKITGNPMALLWLVLAACAFGAVSGGTAAWTYQGARLDAVKAEYKGFVAVTEALGKAAKTKAEAQKAIDALNKETTDANYLQNLADLRTDNKRLRDSRTSGGGLRAPSAPPGSPNRICFDQAQLDRALRVFDEGLLGIVESGGSAVIGLDAAKTWARNRK